MLLGLTVSSGEMLGPAIAGAVIASSGAGAAFILAGVGYASAAGLLTRLPKDVASRGSGANASVASVLRDLRAGAVFIARTQPLPWLVPALAITNIPSAGGLPPDSRLCERRAQSGPGRFRHARLQVVRIDINAGVIEIVHRSSSEDDVEARE